MESIRSFMKKHCATLIGASIGAIGSFLYWYFVGCTSGTCPITSSPLNSILYGILIGGLLGNTIKFKKVKDKDTN